jgi:hypothetical protein
MIKKSFYLKYYKSSLLTTFTNYFAFLNKDFIGLNIVKYPNTAIPITAATSAIFLYDVFER